MTDILVGPGLIWADEDEDEEEEDGEEDDHLLDMFGDDDSSDEEDFNNGLGLDLNPICVIQWYFVNRWIERPERALIHSCQHTNYIYWYLY